MKINTLILFSMTLVMFPDIVGSDQGEIQPLAIEFLDHENAEPIESEEIASNEEMLAQPTDMASEELSAEMLQPESVEPLSDEGIEAVLPDEQTTEPVNPAILTISAELNKIRNEMESMKNALSTSLANTESALRSIEEILQGL